MTRKTRRPSRHVLVRPLLAVPLLVAQACNAQDVAREPPEEYLEAGRQALQWTHRFVEIGPRPAGSAASAAQRRMIVEALEPMVCTVEEDLFVAATPVGALSMGNIVARFGQPSATSVVVVSGHYDTLRMDGFVGANDGGSSAGLLMALAERLDRPDAPAVWLVFFDGEESTVEWRDRDHTYGSRRLAGRWTADGTVARVRALINVDMIGDADLQLVFEGNSNERLRNTVWSLAAALGYDLAFGRSFGFIEDDHIPFVKAGVPSVNLIDFEYGRDNAYWHTLEDTMSKLDSRSFATILHVVEAAIDNLLTD